VDGYADLGSQHGKLLHSRRTNEIAGHEENFPALGFQAVRELGRGRRLARALEPEEKDDGLSVGSSQVEILICVAEKGNHLVVDDFDELLARAYRTKDLFTLRFLQGGINEAPHDAQVHIGFEEGHLYLFDGVLYVFFGYRGLPAYSTEDVDEFFCDFLQHRNPTL